MTIERSKPSVKPSLQQVLTDRVLHDASRQIAVIYANSGLIAECEALSERIAKHIGESNSAPVASVASDLSIYVMVWEQPLSAVREAIRQAGLHIYGEAPRYQFDTEPFLADLRIDLVGYDCPIIATKIAEELSEAA